MRFPRSPTIPVLCTLLALTLMLRTKSRFLSTNVEQASSATRVVEVSPSPVQTSKPSTDPDQAASSLRPAANQTVDGAAANASTGAAQKPTLPGTAKPAGSSEPPGRTIADVLSQSGVDMSEPTVRARVVEEMRTVETGRKAAAWARAEREGVPKRVERPDGSIQEFVDFRGG